MAKEKFELEESFGDFDISDSDFLLGTDKDLPPDTRSDSRKAVENVAKGAYGEIKETAKNPRFYREILRKGFPKTYGAIDDAIDTTSKSMLDLYNEISREEKPKFKRIAGRLAAMLPEEDSKLKKFLLGIEGNRATSYSRESADDAAVNTTLGSIFKAQEARNKLDQAKELVRDRVTKDASDKSLDVLNRIYQNTGALVSYNETITQGYQRKSLELQLRSHLLQAETSRRTLEYLSIQKAQLEAIVKNTALPEYAKLTDYERLKQGFKQSMTDRLYGEGSRIKQGMDAFSEKIRDSITGLSFGLSNAEMGIDGIASMKEQIDQMNQTFIDAGMEPFTKAEIAGAAVGGAGMNWLKDVLGKRLEKHTPMSVREKLASVANTITAPGAKIKKMVDSEEWEAKEMEEGPTGALYRLARTFLEGFMDNKKTASYKKGVDIGNLTDAAKGGITNQANLSLTTVIPGFLASINREIAMLRTGKEQPLYRYDWQRGDFVKESTFEARIMSDVKSAAKASSYEYRVGRVASYFDPENKLSADDQLVLRLFISRISRIDNFSYELEDIQELDAFKSLPDNIQEHVVNFFNEIAGAEDKEQRKFELKTRITEAKDSMSNLRDTIEKKIKNGGADVLKKNGLLKDNNSFDGYDSGGEQMGEFIEKMIFETESDIKVKNRIKPTTAEDILAKQRNKSINWRAPKGQMSGLSPSGKKWTPSGAFEAFKRTKLYDWFYNQTRGDQRPHSGPMANDVRRAFGEEAAPNGETINLQEMNAAYFASVQHIDKRLNDVESGKVGGKSKGVLYDIKDDTGRMVELLQRVGFGFGLPGFDNLKNFDYKSAYTKAKDKISEKLTSAGAKAGRFYDDHVQPKIDDLLNYYNTHKDPAKNKFYELFDTATEMAQSVMKAGNSFFTEKLPTGFRNAKDMLSRTFNRFKDAYLDFKDVYIPGQVEPVLRGIKISAGSYYDKITNKPLLTMKEVLECKNDIIDATGNIVLSIEDRAHGLFDGRGEQFVGFFNKFATRAGELARDGVSRLFSGADKLIGHGKTAFANAKDFLKNAKLGFDFGGISSSKTHQVIVDIRDILLGNKKKVQQRLKAEGEKLSSSSGDAGSSSSGGGSDVTTAENTVQNQTAGGEGQRSTGGLSSLTDAFGTAREKFTELKNSKFGNAVADRYNKTRDRVKNSDLYTSTRDRIKNSEALGKITNSKFGTGAATLLGRAGGWIGGIASAAGSMLASKKEGGEQTQKEGGIDWSAPKGAMSTAGGVLNQLSNRNKNKVAKKDREWNDSDGDGRRDGSIDEQKEKNEALLAERTKNKAALDNTKRYEGGGIAGLIGMAGKLFSFLTSSVTGIIGTIGSVLTKIPGVGALITGAKTAVGSFFKKGILRSAVSLTGRGLMGAARFAIPAIAQVGMAGASLAASAISSVAMTVGGAIVTALSSPVILTAGLVAGAAYGIYKLYQHANRNNANDIEIARLRQYGFGYNTAVQRYNHHIYMLEAYFSDGRINYDSRSPTILAKKVKAEELLEIFGIDVEDSEKVDIFTKWLENRFKPIFLTHVAALYRVNKKAKLSDLSKPEKLLEPGDVAEYLEHARMPSGPYDFDISPIEGMDSLDVNGEEIQENYDNLIKYWRSLAESQATKKKVLPKEIPESPEQTSQRKVVDALKDKPVSKVGPDQKQIEANKKALNESMGGTSEDGGKAPTGAGTASGTPLPSQSIPLAPGGPVDGAGAMQHLKLGRNVNLSGLDPSVAKLFFGMVTEYNTLTGKQVYVESAFRSRADQERVGRENPGKAARPGTSLHEFGLALDISREDAAALEKLGLMRKYGFTRPVGGEPWHIEPAGIQTNIALAKKDPTARTQLVEASLFKGGGGYGTIAGIKNHNRNSKLAIAAMTSGGQPIEPAKMDQLATTLGLGSKNTPTQIAADIQNKTPAEASKAGNAPNPEAVKQAIASGSSSGSGSSGAAGGPGGMTDPREAIRKAAAVANVDENMLLTVASAESSLNPNAKNGNAKGLMQIKDDTWQENLKKHGPKYGFNQNTSPFDPYANAVIAAEYLKANMKGISGLGWGSQATDAYLTHFLGPTGAKKFLSADKNAIAADIRPDAAKENREIFYKPDGTARTVGEVYQHLEQRMAKKASDVGATLPKSTQPTPLPQPQTTASTPSPAPKPQPQRGLMVDTRGMEPPKSTATGSPVAMPSTSHLESLGEKTNEILEDSLAVLKGIQENTKPENFAKILATAMAALNLNSDDGKEKKESAKKQDRRNMGKDAPTTRASLDLNRYAT